MISNNSSGLSVSETSYFEHEKNFYGLMIPGEQKRSELIGEK